MTEPPDIIRLHNPKDGIPIRDWQDWTRPQKAHQWRAGRSAMELARAWFTSPVPVMPPEMTALLEGCEATQGFVAREGWPELETRLPQRGLGRVHDLLLVGRTPKRSLVVAVEAKVDETLGPPVGEYWTSSKNGTRPSNAWKRIEILLHAVFGSGARPDEEPWRSLQYQLLTAVAGSAIETDARGADLGVLVLHHFVTESADPAKIREHEVQLRHLHDCLGLGPPQNGRLSSEFTVATTKGAAAIRVGEVSVVWRRMAVPSPE